ncbi:MULTISPECIES: NAD(P)-dependent oxidoreductase [Peribacillus]|uniref:2-hydroxy-3-oxopropionate reductase n=1 Tax=Peribacillus simplex TaxID=1478 RepID=A0A9W4PIR0_9BACI|nr:NAD(P)-dependent oxidoreductase [Peribacillus simplex]MDR4927408.1 NAD(P)-dependent oxidoreductase [Peribacillus simplex]WHX93733.1 NAD(P)-dependent oxidoreductase [Peribacillus simplex]CAH0290913.1 2-hydroxy-3-oxopropionate reductase [Peribacillus simplex]
MQSNKVIGFIGLGVMGKSMAANLLKAGFEVFVYTRTKDKASELLSKGAKWAFAPKEIAQKANVIISMVGYPSDVEEIYLGENGLIENGKQGTHLIDMTTSTPSLAVKIAEEAKKRGMESLDAPVSGGDIGARDAKLTIMVGGSSEAFEAVRPIFDIIGSNVVHQGPAGSGQHTKMCNQIAIASNMIGVTEAISYAKKAGLDPERVLRSISSGSAGSWSLSNLVPRMVEGDFEPGFYIKHFIKDMKIALDEAERMGMEAPGLSLSKSLYEGLAEAGEENSGTQALYKHYN